MLSRFPRYASLKRILIVAEGKNGGKIALTKNAGMPQLWILMDNSVELPTDSTTDWTTFYVAHIHNLYYYVLFKQLQQ